MPVAPCKKFCLFKVEGAKLKADLKHFYKTYKPSIKAGGTMKSGFFKSASALKSRFPSDHLHIPIIEFFGIV